MNHQLKTTIMTTLSKITIALILSLLLSSCAFDLGNGKKGNGSITEENREIVSEFDQISASEGLDVFVTQADEFSIRVEADENVIDLIATDIKGGTLKIHAKENIGQATKNIFVSLPTITGLSSSSSADLNTKNQIKTNIINISASSGGDLIASILANSIAATSSSGADIKLTGTTNDLAVDASSGSNIDAKNLKTKNCEAEASSGADIKVDVSELLIADASSGGDISYSGTDNVKKNKSSSGSVKKR